MYLTAQRVERGVRDEPLYQNGINAFLYKHGGAVQTPPPNPSVPGTCGQLWSQIAMVTPIGGNKVLSYLDIVCDDDTPWAEINEALKTCASKLVQTAFPWRHVTDCFYVELTMVRAISSQPDRGWLREIGNLCAACRWVYP